MANPIYLDYNATTPCDPRVVQEMLPYFSEVYGNPSNGLHVLGRKASYALEDAREKVASLLNANPGEIIFTSGATESNHLAIIGAAAYAPPNRRKIITCSIEHKAVLSPIKRLAENGFDIVVLPVDSNGLVRQADFEQAIDDTTFLVSIQTANNEIGTIQAIPQMAALAHQRGAIFHTDAAQAVGKIPCNVKEWGIDLLSLSAHKMYGPKGIGALYIRDGKKGIPMRPVLEGGGQEFGMRAGTSNVPAIVGFGAACDIASRELVEDNLRLQRLRDELELKLLTEIHGLQINARTALRLPNTLNITIQGIDADALLLRLPSLMMSTGAACNTGAPEPSHVLLAIGLDREQARSSFRISLGKMTTSNDITEIVEQLVSALKSMPGIL